MVEKKMPFNILVINPGSTSTKVALYKDAQPIFDKEITHTANELSIFNQLTDQQDFRESIILYCLRESNYEIENISCVVARGGALRPVPGGTYLINEKMIQDLKDCRYGVHASNLGALLANKIAKKFRVDAFIVDPITVNEMDEVATVSGIPELKRESIFHALNQKAVARMASNALGKKYENARLIVVHLGGGISVGAHRKGRVVDVNNALNGDGPISPTRSGSVPEWSLVKMAMSGKYAESDFEGRIMTHGGISAYLGTSDLREVKKMASQGDHDAQLVYDAMAYQVAKEIGACASVLEGKVDAIVLTGGLARDTDFINLIMRRTKFIAKFLVYPGSDEMRALTMGALRVLTGEEEALEY